MNGLDSLVTLVIPVLAVAGGRYMYEGIQELLKFVDRKTPVALHGLFLVVVQFGLIQLAQLLGMPLPEALDGWTIEITTAATATAMAMGWHRISKERSGGW